jgi:Ca2+-binding EF-hand superfamily protein
LIDEAGSVRYPLSPMKLINLLFPVALLAGCATTSDPTPQQKFQMADVNKDQLVSRQEATDLIIGNSFDMFDTNGDGVVDEQEYIASGGTAENFRKVNTSGSGKITKLEAQTNPLIVENFAVSFDEADTNGSGTVSYDEYLDYLERLEEAVR